MTNKKVFVISSKHLTVKICLLFRHLLTAQYISECHAFLRVIELLNVVLLFFMAKD